MGIHTFKLAPNERKVLTVPEDLKVSFLTVHTHGFWFLRPPVYVMFGLPSATPPEKEAWRMNDAGYVKDVCVLSRGIGYIFLGNPSQKKAILVDLIIDPEDEDTDRWLHSIKATSGLL